MMYYGYMIARITRINQEFLNFFYKISIWSKFAWIVIAKTSIAQNDAAKITHSSYIPQHRVEGDFIV